MNETPEFLGSPLPELSEGTADPDPFRQFARWFRDAEALVPRLPEAVALATATADARPSVRMVLLRGFDERGFVFFTNYESRKGEELAANPQAALVWHWPALERQIRVEGRVERVSAAESDAYFESRPRGSRLAALASPQSRVLADRAALDARMAEMENRYQNQPVPRPAYWGGYRVIPETIEFWQSRPNRLHNRLRYRRCREDGWRLERLAP